MTLSLLCAAPLAATAEEGIQLKLQRSLIVLPAARGGPAPIFLEADQIRGHAEKETEAQGNVQFRRTGQAISAEWLRYEATLQQLDAKGRVRLQSDASVIEGDVLQFNIGTEHGFMDKPQFRFTPIPRSYESPNPTAPPLASLLTDKPPSEPLPGRGSAERLIFRGPDLYRAQAASYTTCGPGNDDWFIRARELDIDRNRDVGTARGASIVFLDRTILYTPYISFPLQEQRKSGILTPHYGSATTTGAELTVPYYWNIAPNRDATFFPRMMTKRGMQLGTEFRYLESGYSGTARVEVLPDDRQLGTNRHAYFFRHAHSFGSDWTAGLNLNRVSDDRYFTDLSSLVAVTSRTTLPTEGTLSRSGPWGESGNYAFSALAQRWQTLQPDPRAPITPPYNRQPQVTLAANRQDLYRTDFDFMSSFVSFEHPTLVNGRRVLAYPNLALPLQSSFAYFVPKAGVHATRYYLGPNTQGLQEQSRTLPVFTADSGLVFERETKITGLPFIQTLEPKLYYVYIPYRDQSRLPNFDSGVQDVSFATMFSENQFSGADRINDANQATIGATSRFIHPDTGIERLRLTLAQRYYFQSQLVTLPGVARRPDHRTSSDLLAALSGTILPHLRMEAGWQYSADRSQTQKFNIATRYQPTPGKVLNVAYRNTVNLVDQTDLSFQWPMSPRWRAVGRWNWSLRDSRTLEALAGVEYDGGCWAVRAVGHRFATALNTVNTTFFVQLELNGVSRIGSNPLDVLRRNVGGYTRHDPRAPRTDEYHIPER